MSPTFSPADFSREWVTSVISIFRGVIVFYVDYRTNAAYARAYVLSASIA